MNKAKSILEKNQYPPLFYEPIIAETINKIQDPSTSTSQSTNANEQVGPARNHRMLLQYRGSVTDQFVKRLKDVGAPTQVVLTLRKIKTFLPSLKASVPKMIKSNFFTK